MVSYVTSWSHCIIEWYLKGHGCAGVNRIHGFSDVRSGVAEHSAFLGYDAALRGKLIPTFLGKAELSSSRVGMSSKRRDPITHLRSVMSWRKGMLRIYLAYVIVNIQVSQNVDNLKIS
jgi:hypothetical protein